MDSVSKIADENFFDVDSVSKIVDMILSHDFLGFCPEASWLIPLTGALVVATVSARAAA